MNELQALSAADQDRVIRLAFSISLDTTRAVYPQALSAVAPAASPEFWAFLMKMIEMLLPILIKLLFPT